MTKTEIKPLKKQRTMDLVKEAGLDVSDWAKFKNGKNEKKAASNPRYCYDWSFIDGDKIVINLWYVDLIESQDGKILRQHNSRILSQKDTKQLWRSRATKLDNAIRTAYASQLPLRVIIGDGVKRTSDELTAKASKIHTRMLDPIPWAVASYSIATGDYILERGLLPIITSNNLDYDQDDTEGLEGEKRARLIIHRKREGNLRRKKILTALQQNNGRLICEVPRCGFDFIKVYGLLGEGYAHVHHKIPLSEAPDNGRNTKLEDLAIVCANCHAMIHRYGECRSMESLIPEKNKK